MLALMQMVPSVPQGALGMVNLGTVVQVLFFAVICVCAVATLVLQTRRARVSVAHEEANAWKSLAQARAEEMTNLCRRVTDMETRVADLRRENEELRTLNISLQRENAELRHRVDELERLVRERRELAQENSEFREEIRRLKSLIRERETSNED